MTEDEIKNLNELFTELKNIMKKYGRYEHRFQFKSICDIVDITCSSLSIRDKTNLIIQKYNSLYPPHGGLAEFYIHDNDPKRLRELNRPLSKIKKDIWEIMQNYV